MIADAWYMVTEYHLNLGPRDNLEKLVHYIADTTGMQPNTRKKEILNWLKSCEDPIVIRKKNDLITNVPFRLQSPFIENFRSKMLDCAPNRQVLLINQQKRMIYYFGAFAGLNTHIIIAPEWMDYLKDNQEILRGWVQYNMIIYLQRRNPSVPGISDKLYPPQERKLDKVKKYWRLITELSPIHEIYGENLLTPKTISIDHFVPWSYVAHDEFWNLHPTTRSINSSKSNHLPDWELYFPRFADLEYQSYQMIWQYDRIREKFMDCAKEHLNNPEIEHRLYRQGLAQEVFTRQLEELIQPVYQAAQTCGFGRWEYTS